VIAPKDRAAGITPVVSKVASGRRRGHALSDGHQPRAHAGRDQGAHIWAIGTDERAEKTLYETDLPESIAWVLGAEARACAASRARAATRW